MFETANNKLGQSTGVTLEHFDTCWEPQESDKSNVVLVEKPNDRYNNPTL